MYPISQVISKILGLELSKSFGAKIVQKLLGQKRHATRLVLRIDLSKNLGVGSVQKLLGWKCPKALGQKCPEALGPEVSKG